MDRHVCPLQPACGLSVQPVGHSRHGRDHSLLAFHWITTRVGACFSAAPFNLRAILPRSQTGTVERTCCSPHPTLNRWNVSLSRNGTGWTATPAPSSLHAISPCGL